MKLLSTRSPNMIVALTSIAGILISALVLFGNRSRSDPGLWLWTAGLIVVVAVIGVPLSIWHQRAVAAGKLPRAPWPTASAAWDARKRPPPPGISIRGRFTWTVPEFFRMKNAWLRYTPAGRNYRWTTFGLSALALIGMALATVWLAQ